MPEFARHVAHTNCTHPLCPLLNEGEKLPSGLTYWQRYHLTGGRLAKDYEMNLLIAKTSSANYGMGITIVNSEESIQKETIVNEEAPLSLWEKVKSKASNFIKGVQKLWK